MCMCMCVDGCGCGVDVKVDVYVCEYVYVHGQVDRYEHSVEVPLQTESDAIGASPGAIGADRNRLAKSRIYIKAQANRHQTSGEGEIESVYVYARVYVYVYVWVYLCKHENTAKEHETSMYVCVWVGAQGRQKRTYTGSQTPE